MASDENQRRLTNEDALHVGMATRSPGAYLFSCIVIELIKLPFTLIGSAFRAIKSSGEKRRREVVLVAEKAKAEQAQKEELGWRMEQRKKAYIARKEEEKRQAMVESMKPKPVEPEVNSEIGDGARWVWREEAAPGLIFDDYLYALELFKTQEGRDFIATRGLSPEAVERRLQELHEQNLKPRGGSTMRLAPITKSAIRNAGRAARERFYRENPGQSGVTEVTIFDLLEGAVNTERFVQEMDPIWEHLRNAKQS